MPIYTYRCQKCGFKLTQMQKFSDESLTYCSECRASTLERVLQLSPIIFKGSGWYSTDHRPGSGQFRTPDRRKDEAAISPGEKSRG
jgi:putative FmdB family regulatory protein